MIPTAVTIGGQATRAARQHQHWLSQKVREFELALTNKDGADGAGLLHCSSKGCHCEQLAAVKDEKALEQGQHAPLRVRPLR